jgi:hypothetical protein
MAPPPFEEANIFEKKELGNMSIVWHQNKTISRRVILFNIHVT